MGNSKYFYTYAKEKDKYYLIIRHLNNALVTNEEVSELANNNFSMDIYDNKGIIGVENILFINYLSEACGVDGGGIYLFQINDVIKKVYRISQISDAGIFWLNEKLIFPSDDDGIKGKIVYQKEVGYYKDDGTNWLEVKKITRELEWKSGEILPKLEIEK